MRSSAAILLSLLVLSVSLKDLAVYLSFRLNQSYIAENLCVNLDRPEIMCYGKCFLDKEMKDSQEKTGKLPSPHRQERVVFIFNDIPTAFRPFFQQESGAALFHFRVFSPDPSLESVFHPPRIDPFTA